MCTYVRFENLKITLSCIKKQTNQDFNFYIIDNSNRHEKLLKHLEKYGNGIDVTVHNYENEFKQFNKNFYYC